MDKDDELRMAAAAPPAFGPESGSSGPAAAAAVQAGPGVRPAPPGRRWRRWRRPLAGLAVSAIFVWLALSAVPPGEIGPVLARLRPGWLLAALGLFGLGYACRIQRWRLMLAAANPDPGWRRAMVPFMVSIAANNVLPFRAGDVLRAFGFSGWLGVPAASVLATLLAERLMDLLALLVALGLALWLLGPVMGGLSGGLPGLGAAGALGLAGAVLMLLLLPGLVARPLMALLARLERRFPGLAAAARPQAERVLGTLGLLAGRRRMPVLLGWSLAAWACEAGVFYAVARALPDLAAPLGAWAAMPVGTLSTLLPSTPGYVGTFHYFVIQAMSAFGNGAAAAAAFALVVHLALWLPATLWGGVCFLYWLWRRAARPPAETSDV